MQIKQLCHWVNYFIAGVIIKKILQASIVIHVFNSANARMWNLF